MPKEFLKKLFRAVFPHKSPISIKREYHLPDSLNWTIKITPEGWFVATSNELPGLVTQAKSQEELLEMINDAVLTYYDVPKRDADIVYDQLKFGDQIMQYKGELVTSVA